MYSEERVLKDLKRKSIEETCTQHNIKFIDLFNLCHEVYPRPQIVKGGENMYLSRNGGAVSIKKKVNGRHDYFGTYSSIEDARKVRDKLAECDWDKNRLSDICKELGVVRNGYNK